MNRRVRIVNIKNNSIIYCNESELEIYKNILSDNSYYEYI